MKKLLLLSLVMFLFSCTIEKRLYRPGYHVESILFSKSSTGAGPKEVPEKVKPRHENTLEFQTKELKRSLKAEPSLVTFSNLCDTLVMENGDKLIVKVETVAENKITYRKCDNVEGPLYEESLSNINYLHFSNGKIEKIGSPNADNRDYNASAKSGQNSSWMPSDATSKKPIEPFGLTSILAFTASWITASILPTFALILSLVSLVFAIISLVRFKDEPNRFRGKWMPLTVLALFILGIILLLFLIAILLAAFG